MSIKEFCKNFSNQFDYVPDDFEISETTNFVELEDWDSLVALSVIAMIDEKYNVNLSGDDMYASTSVGDLFKIVSERIA